MMTITAKVEEEAVFSVTESCLLQAKFVKIMTLTTIIKKLQHKLT